MDRIEKMIRGHVRNWFCDKTEDECHQAIAAEYDLPTSVLKVRFMIEWCCEGEFWEGSF
jgi:hypothetical protein